MSLEDLGYYKEFINEDQYNELVKEGDEIELTII